MITYTSGNILESTADVIVIPTNTKGVAGKGLAKAAAEKWPAWEKLYSNMKDGWYVAGHIYWFHLPERRFICAMMTKDHWKDPSQLKWISSALDELRVNCGCDTINTVAMPQVGCGLGGLSWRDVQREIENRLSWANFDTTVYLT